MFDDHTPYTYIYIPIYIYIYLPICIYIYSTHILFIWFSMFFPYWMIIPNKDWMMLFPPETHFLGLGGGFICSWFNQVESILPAYTSIPPKKSSIFMFCCMLKSWFPNVSLAKNPANLLRAAPARRLARFKAFSSISLSRGGRTKNHEEHGATSTLWINGISWLFSGI